MPDVAKDRSAGKRIRCGTCHAVTETLLEVFTRIPAVKYSKVVREEDAIGAFETGCGKAGKEVGLQLRSGKVTEIVSRNKMISAAKGGWIGAQALMICAEINEEHEDRFLKGLLAVIKGAESEERFKDRFCTEIKKCEKGFDRKVEPDMEEKFMAKKREMDKEQELEELRNEL